jgi:ribosomal protein S8
MRRTRLVAAKVFNIPWDPSDKRDGNTGVGGWRALRDAKERAGMIPHGQARDDRNVRRALNAYLEDSDPIYRKLTKLPGVEFESDLPADPVTRLFFQTKGSHALYQGTYDDPVRKDIDRIEIERRDMLRNPDDVQYFIPTPVTDMCLRVMEGCEMRKRFVVVPATFETKGIASRMLDHGLLAGFRDFHNDRAFAVELKYFQNEPVLQIMEPCSRDKKAQFEYSPSAVRYFGKTAGRHQAVRILCIRTFDGRILDNLQATKEGLGGTGLLMFG